MFDETVWCKVASYMRHDKGEEPAEYEFMYATGRALNDENYERKLYRELAWALADATDEHDGVCVVAYATADDTNEFEGSSYAVIAYEQQPGRGVTVWIGDEVAEQIQLW